MPLPFTTSLKKFFLLWFGVAVMWKELTFDSVGHNQKSG